MTRTVVASWLKRKKRSAVELCSSRAPLCHHASTPTVSEWTQSVLAAGSLLSTGSAVSAAPWCWTSPALSHSSPASASPARHASSSTQISRNAASMPKA
jgi:hypothetical protein